MNRKLKSVSIFFIVILFTFSIIPFSAAASEVQFLPHDQSVTNLLPASNYRVKIGSNDFVDSNYPGGNTDIFTYLLIQWNNADSSRSFEYIYFNIRADKPVTTVRFTPDLETTVATIPNAELVGFHNDLYQFRISVSDFLFDTFYLRIHFGSNTGVNVLLESCYAVSRDYVLFETFDVKSDMIYVQSGNSDLGALQHSELLDEIIEFGYPYEFIYEHNTVNNINWISCDNYVELILSTIEYQKIDKVKLYVGAIALNYVNAGLTYGGTEVVNALPVTVNLCSTWDQVYNSSTSSDWTISIYEITIDLSHYDVSQNDINTPAVRICFNTDPYTNLLGEEFMYFCITGAFYSPLNIDIPWYQEFWFWIKGGLKDLGEYIVNGLDGATDKQTQEIIQGQQQQTQEIIEGQEQQTNDIITGGDKSEDMQQEQSSLKDQSDDIAKLDEEIFTSVDEFLPEWDIDALLAPVLHFDSNAIELISSLWGGSFTIVPLMTVSSTFAFIGFVFFGKRG